MVQDPKLDIEQSFWETGIVRVAGVDEAGLGCLAGPIVAAAVILPPEVTPIPGVRDSKQVSAAKRIQLLPKIQAQAIAVGVGVASVAEVDQWNVLRASYLAMQRALARVAPVDHALIDGREIYHADLGSVTTIIHGDALSYSIACASIVAKVRRDRFMQCLAKRYPGYGWERNAGYGTQQHREALQTLGVTPWHRKSYAPVQAVMQQLPLFEP
ncbi:ribonuclease HII [Alkalinema sp. FACHB-956]|uniref:ribonuclease HII n=1 Tax=Alkalinema sp. FACHB-956 TaxID=2692768 RepID=UPI0016881C0C|nr:ribonuclease HII [Alkalinema sp. FACHB-956]MBD2328989.1 ribonuclease HII [Alkalinema sp. FACHB-956]